tara:strand:- start:469 stop:672 length:204 start_codon:yes stop_codon:yes gene_type:complete
MALTLEELKERLTQLDEVILIDVLQLEAQDIVDRFEDVIERNFVMLEAQVLESVHKGLYDEWEEDYD